MTIKIVNTKAKAVALLTPETHLWGFEKKKGGGAMSFIVGTHEELIKMYVGSAGHRFHHEILMDDAHPIKLFFDIDGPPETTSDVVDSLHRYVTEQIGGCDTPMVLDASDQTKFSKHVIYPLAFKNKAILREFVHDLKNIVPVDDPLYGLIDFSVYNTDHSLRMIGSSKRKVGRPFLFEGRPTVTRLVVERSLIRFVHQSDTPIDTWGNHVGPCTGIKRACYSTQEVEWVGWTDEMRNTLCDKLVIFTKTKYKCKYTNVKWLGNRLAVSIHPGIYCPNKERKHKSSNRTSVLYMVPVVYSERMDIQVKVICMDNECREDEHQFVIDRYNIPVIKKATT